MQKFPGLEKYRKQIAKASETRMISLSELFPPPFMSRYTQSPTFADFLKAGGFEINSMEDFKAIPDDAFDEYIRSASVFSSWEAMQKMALREYASKALKV